MKHYKKIILTLALLLTAVTGAWAQNAPTTYPFPITWDATNKTTGFSLPAGNVFMNVEYYPAAAVATAPAAKPVTPAPKPVAKPAEKPAPKPAAKPAAPKPPPPSQPPVKNPEAPKTETIDVGTPSGNATPWLIEQQDL